MAGVQRQGDPNVAGGVAMGGESSVKVNGRAILVSGIKVSPHPCCGRRGCSPLHCSCVTKGGTSTVRANGKLVITDLDIDQCGHPRVGGSTNVGIG
jgi:uncharacterized Zn-binding protein involved in type VI secretion